MAAPYFVRRIATAVAVLVVVVAVIGALVWWKFFTEEPQTFADDAERFNYGSLGSEAVVGIPYPIFMILPRGFPGLVEKYATEGYGPAQAGYGGCGAVRIGWGEGQRRPGGLLITPHRYEPGTI